MRIELSADARARVDRARGVVDRWIAEGRVVYGLTTGFGEFANVVIPPADVHALQENLIISHAAGMGPLLPPEIVRAMMILRVTALAKGHSGVRSSTLDALIAMINANIIPVVPSHAKRRLVAGAWYSACGA